MGYRFIHFIVIVIVFFVFYQKLHLEDYMKKIINDIRKNIFNQNWIDHLLYMLFLLLPGNKQWKTKPEKSFMWMNVSLIQDCNSIVENFFRDRWHLSQDVKCRKLWSICNKLRKNSEIANVDSSFEWNWAFLYHFFQRENFFSLCKKFKSR